MGYFLWLCTYAGCLCVLRRNAAGRFVGTKQLKSTEKPGLSEKGEETVGAHLSAGTASSLALPLCFDYFLISLPHWLALSNSDLLDCFLDHILLV